MTQFTRTQVSKYRPLTLKERVTLTMDVSRSNWFEPKWQDLLMIIQDYPRESVRRTYWAYIKERNDEETWYKLGKKEKEEAQKSMIAVWFLFAISIVISLYIMFR